MDLRERLEAGEALAEGVQKRRRELLDAGGALFDKGSPDLKRLRLDQLMDPMAQ